MSDYSQITNFTAKDALSTGDPEKIISGADIDAELSAIDAAITSKYDSTDVASQAQAEALTSNSVLMTPLAVDYVLKDNSGILSDLQALGSLATNGDKLFFFDDTDDTTKALTIGDGIEISGTTIQLPSTVAGNGLTLTSGVLAVVGGSGITANANDIALTDAAATTSNPIDVSSGTISVDLTALTNIEGSALAATDEFLVDDGGTPKAIAVQDAGFRIQGSQTTQTLAADDMNSIMKFTGTATLTIAANASVDIPLGVPVLLVMDHASQVLTVTAAASVTLESVFHPGGGVAASDTVRAGGMAVLIQTETDVWQLTGDIST